MWKCIISSRDLDLDDTTKEELLNLICASIPVREMKSQLARLAVHIMKEMVYHKKTPSWSAMIKDAISEIKSENRRYRTKKQSLYFSNEELKELLSERWNKVLSWVSSESDGKWSVRRLEGMDLLDKIWFRIETLLEV